MKNGIKFLALLWAVGLLAACATKVDGLFVKDDFRAPALRQGGLLVGGVVAEPGKFDLLRSHDFSTTMTSEFHSERGYIKIVPPEVLINNLGEDGYLKLMSQYATTGLDAASLAQIAGKVSGIRYLALAKIDSNTTHQDRSETQPYEYKDKDGTVNKVPGNITLSNTREVAVTLTIYDLESRSTAFSGQVTKSLAASNSYANDVASDVMAVVSAALDKNGNGLYITPEAPATRNVLSDVFDGFAENLPKLD